MTMRVCNALPPSPRSPASMSEPSRLPGAALPSRAESEPVDYCPMYTEDDEYQALMLADAEFGPLVQAMMLADDGEKIQSRAPLLLPEDKSQVMLGDESETQACPPCPNDKEGRKKRKKPPPPPEDAFDEPSPRSSKRAKEIEEPPSLRAMNKMMATCLLERRHSAPEPSGQTIIRCRCEELPRGCPLHQHAPFQSWMLEVGDGEIPGVGSEDGVVVPKTRTESKSTVLGYIRWRSRVWMPSRFYVEQARLARQE